MKVRQLKKLLTKNLKRDQNNLVIFNSCAVTANAEKQLAQSIRKIAKENPDKKLIVTGCAAQINPAKYAKMPEIYRVIGNNDKFDESSYFDKDFSKNNHDKKPVNSSNHADKLFFAENKDFFNSDLEEKLK